MRQISLLIALIVASACDTKMSMEPRLRFDLTRSEAHIDEAERISRAGGDPTFPCTAVKQMVAGLADETLQTVNATVVRGRKVCRDVTMKFAETLVARLETRDGSLDVAQRPAQSKARDCVDLSRSLALARALDGALAKDDPAATTLDKKRKILCP